MIDVYAWGTTNGLRATLAMAECGLPHKVFPVDLSRKANKSPEYLAINPTGQVPTIVDHDAPEGGRILAQSGAIVLHACRKAGRYIPADTTTYNAAMQWFMHAATDIGGASAGLQQVAVVAPEKVQSTIEIFEQRFIRYFSYVDQQLTDRDFIAGEFSFADIMLYPNYLLRKQLVERSGNFHHIKTWAERLERRPGVRAGMTLLKA
ncbi:disulfide-bond oxidoreductase YfcG [Variibacter gotjawalensis]|uniref:Disulfide-bond oxidoreductase YfcG n=1 Tax=Variibacter gotjawalensis TaxID=1333996 RepID=A0A0S3Q0Z1_9BRAD|nr:glutathione S-transferase family protein [Variibacter gotjawalensis]NIK47666.1 GST-like protein [Variibacter gotjawalensis]RZS49564.1 GST-like protein [Variibacter gotjawalensis]BAT61826.1 disulfide-bond oxidoreductase YfcG [Variibacter gotjawalensis]